MTKQKLIFRGPVTTASGYGVHARQLLKALIESEKFDISVIGTNWGATSFLLEDSPFITQINELIRKGEFESQQKVQYDISVQVTIPNEFSKMARVNIGVTAGIEVDRVSPEWIKKANENVDLVIVPSVHSANTYKDIAYKDENGNTLKLEKPIAILPESVDTDVFNTSDIGDYKIADFDADFNFLFVGLGLDKGMGEDRKNLSTLIKWFCEKFNGDKTVGLVLKSGLVNNSLMDFEHTKRKIQEIKTSLGIGEFPRIHLIHGRLSDNDLASLYKHPKIKVFVSLTHGEGYGLPLIEAAACGLPIMTTGWSGQLDFLSVDNKKRFISIDYDLAPIPKSAIWKNVMEEGSRWANAREEDTKLKLKKVILSYEKPKEWANELAKNISEKYSSKVLSNDFVNLLNNFLGKSKDTPKTREDAAVSLKRELGDLQGSKSLLYTMPMSAGDVYISTAVIDGLKKKFPDHKIFFATELKYSSILKGNPNIHRVVGWQNWMADIPFCELVFDEVYTPNLAIQLTHSNWVHGGKGRLLGEEMANNCRVDFGQYYIETEQVNGLPEKFVVLNPGSGKGQWEARSYSKWQEVVDNVKAATSLPVVQVGLLDNPLYDGCVDFRGKTNYNQLAYTISKAECVVGIDSVTMHLAAGLDVSYVALFGSSYSTSTGPVRTSSNTKSLGILLDSPTRYGCDKACYKYQCNQNPDYPCVNEISPKLVTNSVLKTLDVAPLGDNYKEHKPTISGYTHLLNAKRQGYPFLQSIKSMLGFCDEVVIVDGGSDDGTVEAIKELNDDKIKIYERKWDWEEPGMDGMQKAYGRAMCSGEYLWQMDADEIVHERDYEKIKNVVKRFPKSTELLHLPVVELWGDDKTVRTDRHSWKWRLSKNNFRITHGINRDARVTDEKTGKTFAKKGMSDGCEYVDIMTGEYIQHKGFYDSKLELKRQTDPEAYGDEMNGVFKTFPSVYHYSWVDIPQKIRNFRDFWDKCWGNLYNEEQEQRFFKGRDLTTVSEEEIQELAEQMRNQGGEHGQAKTFKLEIDPPASMTGWKSK